MGLASLLVALLVASGTAGVAAEEAKGAEQTAAEDKASGSEGERSGAVWEGVRRLEASYAKTRWIDGWPDVLTGGLYLGFGIYRLVLHRRRGIRTVGAFDFPWPGLNFTLLGSRGLATGIYAIARRKGKHTRARRVLEEGTSEEMARFYLENRAEMAKRERVMGGLGMIAASTLGTVYTVGLPAEGGRDRAINIASGGATLLIGVGVGIYRLANPSLEERVWEDVK